MQEINRLRLTDSFLESYKDRQPPWGFNGLGWVVYARTYSRPLPSGEGNEKWWNTIQRVVEGVYYTQQIHCAKNGLPWNPQKAQLSAQRMYELFFNFKMLPPGRGLWAMGTKYVEDRGSAALNNPLHEDTQILTKEYGWIRMGDVAGQSLHVLSSAKDYGSHAELVSNCSGVSTPKWVPAQMSEVELQPCSLITFRTKDGTETQITSSDTHRWFRRRTTKTPWERVTLGQLSVGDYVPMVKPHRNFKPSSTGVLHGMFFGDGTRSNGELHLFGPKIGVAQRIVASSQLHKGTRKDEVIMRQCPMSWSNIPKDSYADDQRYVWGFLSGYVASDGHVDLKGNVTLSSARVDELRVVSKLFMNNGVRVSPVSVSIPEGAKNNFSDNRKTLYKIKVTAIDLDAKFFVRDDQRKRWESGIGSTNRDWVRIVNITPLQGEYPVLCAEVSGYEQFVTEGFILTSNCAFISTEGIRRDFSYPFTFLMDMSMLGVGVGGDVRGAGTMTIHEATVSDEIYTIQDSREGWVESVRILLDAFVGRGKLVTYDYSQIRPSGAPLSGFGGVASGPEPLEYLHVQLIALLTAGVGSDITSTMIVDIFNMIGRCVVAGGIRRSAEIMLGNPDDTEFVQLKDPELWPNEMESHRWASNNSLFSTVGMEYKSFVDQITRTRSGEPGFFWLDNARHHGRMKDPRGDWDVFIMGQNPCVTGDTLVWTDKGLVSIASICSSTSDIRVLQDRRLSDIGCSGHKGIVSRGVKDVVRLRLSNGMQLRLTPDHKVVTTEGKVPASKLTSDHRILVSSLSVPTDSLNESEISLGELRGWMVGDGCMSSDRLDFYHDKQDMLPRITENLIETGLVYSENRQPNQNRTCITVRGLGIYEKKRLDPVVALGSVSQQIGFLRGLFSADGSVQGNCQSGHSIRLSSSSVSLLRDVQQMLLLFGIHGRVYEERRPAGVRELPDGKGGTKSYWCQADHELVLSCSSMYLFAERIGWIDGSPQIARWESLLESVVNKPRSESYLTSVESVEPDGSEEVFDVLSTDTGTFVANGLVVSNCGEIGLESGEFCVSGDTPLLLRNGMVRISKSPTGVPIEVWNGDSWSSVIPRITGTDRKLYRVTLSDGSYLDCTAHHRWSVKTPTQSVFHEVETQDLTVNSSCESFSLGEINGVPLPNAFEWGMFAGDGYLEYRKNDRIIPLICIHGDKAKLKDLGVSGTWRKEQTLSGYTFPVNRLNISEVVGDRISDAVKMNNKDAGLGDWLFNLDRDSILEFLAGYIEADGTINNKGQRSEGYRLYGSEQKMRDMQLLARRAGLDFVTLTKFAEQGDETNYGRRSRSLWYLTIPSFEADVIPTRVKRATSFGSRYAKNNAHSSGLKIDRARKQRIVSVEELPGTHTTYCFDEPENHKAVFGNVLTHQCNLVEVYPAHHDTWEELQITLKWAYLYSKTVSLMPTHNPNTNAIIGRNRRIGVSVSGVAQAIQKFRPRKFFDLLDKGYEYLRHLDGIYSKWLCVPESIKLTTVKPSGTISLLPGATPGIHFPHSEYYVRNVRFDPWSPLLPVLRKAGYKIEPSVAKDDTFVVSFPIKEKYFAKSKFGVSVWEQFELAAQMQHWWADNAVSVTVTFRDDEADEIPRILSLYETRLKSVSLLPLEGHGYVQAPYIECDQDAYEKLFSEIRPFDFEIEGRTHDIDEKYCDGESCAVL